MLEWHNLDNLIWNKLFTFCKELTAGAGDSLPQVNESCFGWVELPMLLPPFEVLTGSSLNNFSSSASNSVESLEQSRTSDVEFVPSSLIAGSTSALNLSKFPLTTDNSRGFKTPIQKKETVRNNIYPLIFIFRQH